MNVDHILQRLQAEAFELDSFGASTYLPDVARQILESELVATPTGARTMSIILRCNSPSFLAAATTVDASIPPEEVHFYSDGRLIGKLNL